MDKDKNNVFIVAIVAIIAIFALMLFARGNVGQATSDSESHVESSVPGVQVQQIPIDDDFDGRVDRFIDIPIY